MFRSLFSGNKKQVLQEARLIQFREAWLLANRSLLAVKSEAIEQEQEIDAEILVREAIQWFRNQKTTFSSDEHKTEQLTIRLLPIVQQIYAASDRFSNEADVSSAHNSTSQRILEYMTKRIRTDRLKVASSSEELTPTEQKILTDVADVASSYWQVR